MACSYFRIGGANKQLNVMEEDFTLPDDMFTDNPVFVDTSQEFDDEVKARFDVSLRESSIEELPGSEEELGIHMQLDYKQAVELAEEQALNVLFEGNKYGISKTEIAELKPPKNAAGETVASNVPI